MMIHEKFAPSAEVHGGGHAAWPLSSSQARIWRLSETGNEDVYGRQILAIGFHPASLCVARDALETLLALYPELSRRFRPSPEGSFTRASATLLQSTGWSLALRTTTP